jgi:hypothetical protein
MLGLRLLCGPEAELGNALDIVLECICTLCQGLDAAT